VLGVCAALLATGLVAGLLIPAASQGTQTETFTLCEKNNKGFTKSVDEGKGPSGDWEVSSYPMYNPSTGKRAGTDVGRFTFVRPLGQRNGIGIVDATVFLAKGKLTGYAAFKFSSFRKGAKFAVTGGTGRYRNATGSVTVQPAKCAGARGSRLVFNIVR
jgi:hypothetical protein